MRRARAVLLAMTFSFAAIVSATRPASVHACSCEAWRPLTSYATDPAFAVFSGRVAERLHGPVVAAGAEATGFEFRVERWFWGADAAGVVTVASVGELGCGIELHAGDHLVTVAWRVEPGPWMPSICQPWADVDSPDGARLLAEAAAVFGPGVEPDPPPERAPADPVPYFLFGLLSAGGLFALASIVSRRRDSHA